MPPKGYKAITISKKVFDILTELTRKKMLQTGKYISRSQFLTDLILLKAKEAAQ